MAVIALEGLHFYGYHGFYEEEQIIGNHYYVDVYLTTNIARAAATDDLYATINYEVVYFICQSEMRKPTNLLETLAQSIAERLAGHFDKVQEVRVRVRKMNPPLGGPVHSAFVEYSTGGGGGRDDDDDDDDYMFGGGMFSVE